MAYRVILADDHPVVLKGLTLALTKDRVAEVVGEAQSPNALLSLLGETACDALVTDFSMPGHEDDGLRLLAEVKRRHPALPTMVITTVVNPALYREMLATGVMALVGKTGDAREIPEAFVSMMSQSVYLGSSVRELLRRPSRVSARDGSWGTLTALSPRELEVLQLFAAGQNVSEIARATGRGLSTVSQQKTNAMRKLGLGTDTEVYEYVDYLQLPKPSDSGSPR
ncbi:response regulator transcription factor [Luteibacter sahnii]|uniref:response regulator transcription factor n=1 Tax=Luteibacter sahnii TaxID=3021977 RepID=UPI002A6AB3BD|nr:response regulator transcription factor [Luteibacter sp. PPL193]MDY1549913.1 response regulator transcription factor [Luteibacter sp. PPL193]